MPIKLENVAIAVRDLEETIAFFTDLGLTVLGRDTVSGEWTDTAVGLDGNHAKIAMLQTPDGNGHLELFEYIRGDARLLPAARGGDLRGRLQTHLSPRPQRHHRDARREAQPALIGVRAREHSVSPRFTVIDKVVEIEFSSAEGELLR
jgi:catechol 2,3-dioxygenase-like lactoylglutathione lyase family enzyme